MPQKPYGDIFTEFSAKFYSGCTSVSSVRIFQFQLQSFLSKCVKG